MALVSKKGLIEIFHACKLGKRGRGSMRLLALPDQSKVKQDKINSIPPLYASLIVCFPLSLADLFRKKL
jgi:hypothetical protein